MMNSDFLKPGRDAHLERKAGNAMKTIGLLGGMSWESSIEYYRIINETVRKRLGGLHSAKSIMYSVDFAEIEQLQDQGRWNEATALMIDGAERLERGGADFLVICTNTMHKMADEVEAQIQIPLLHIADATAETLKARDLKQIGLLGTRFTMEQDFYKGRLTEKYGLKVLIPNQEEREMIHRVIYHELCMGIVSSSSRKDFAHVLDHLTEGGAEGIILGCTEIGLLIGEGDSPVPLFDTTRIHAVAAVAYALSEKNDS
jgi:aspartate racemase